MVVITDLYIVLEIKLHNGTLLNRNSVSTCCIVDKVINRIELILFSSV